MRMEKCDDAPTSDLERWRKTAWLQIKGAVSWYFFLGVAIAIITPNHLANNALVRSIIHYVELAIPALPKFVAISDFPGLTAFYFGVMWIVLPIPIAMIVAKWPSLPHPTARQSAIIVFLAPLVVMIILGVLYVLPLPDKFQASYRRGQGIAFLALISQFRLGLGLLMSISFTMLATATGTWIKFVSVQILSLVVANRKA